MTGRAVSLVALAVCVAGLAIWAAFWGPAEGWTSVADRETPATTGVPPSVVGWQCVPVQLVAVGLVAP